ncbi:YfjI family protein [Acetobacterium tundrae]|uniref:DUF3987 domain-containing protein n=1 Tax=Acetobacterium tundrae TaxID=132932 RepID=A0ABR6WKX2_9FIRM|nr:YfjI family protein [Acetobacterium tundrae]MBC3797162.1 DUF3987 domain-containing protein [Acetobacterium tundrae]
MNESDIRNLKEIMEKKDHPVELDGQGNDDLTIILHPNFTTDDQEAQEKKAFEWQQPKPLEKERVLPHFPLESLPETIRNYVEAVAESTATAIDMAAVAALAVVASAVQKKYQIRGKPDYFEPLNLYTLIIADPAERKSSVMREMTKYTKEYEREVNQDRREIIDRQTIEINSKLNQISKCEKNGEVGEAIELKKQCRELEDQAIRPLRLIADDITPEALTTLLAENNGALSVMSSEGGFFDTLAGRYSNAICIDTILKAHPGDDINVDRKGRPKEYIRSPALTILLSVQNDVIRGLFDNGTFKGRGLNARFLYSKPISKIGTRSFETKPIPEESKILYKELLYKLHDIPIITGEAPRTITLSPAAYSMLKSYFDLIEPELVGEFEEMRDWAGKLIGATLRIAGILHCMDYEKLINNVPVDIDTMINAINIANYYIEHSRAAYQLMGVDENIQLAKFVLKRLEQKPKEKYKKHDIYLISRNSKINVTADIEQPLSILVEYGYLYEVVQKVVVRPGKKPDLEYKLNPLHFRF